MYEGSRAAAAAPVLRVEEKQPVARRIEPAWFFVPVKSRGGAVIKRVERRELLGACDIVAGRRGVYLGDRLIQELPPGRYCEGSGTTTAW